MSDINFGIDLSNRGLVFLKDEYKFENLLQIAESAESEGWYCLTLGDGFIAKPRWDPIILHSAIAMVTKKIKLATATLNINYREPLLFARDWAVLDNISHGRTVLGLGVGSTSRSSIGGIEVTIDREMELVGNGRHIQRKGSMLEEWIILCRKLWTEDFVSFHGKSFNYDGVRIEPKPYQKPSPPIKMAAGVVDLKDFVIDRLARVADGWLTSSVDVEKFQNTWARVKERLKANKRDVNQFSVTFEVSGVLAEDPTTVKADMSAWYKGYYGVESAEQVSRFAVGNASYWIKQFTKWADAGVNTFSLRIPSTKLEDQVKAFSKQVLPSF